MKAEDCTLIKKGMKNILKKIKENWRFIGLELIVILSLVALIIFAWCGEEHVRTKQRECYQAISEKRYEEAIDILQTSYGHSNGLLSYLHAHYNEIPERELGEILQKIVADWEGEY